MVRSKAEVPTPADGRRHFQRDMPLRSEILPYIETDLSEGAPTQQEFVLPPHLKPSAADIDRVEAEIHARIAARKANGRNAQAAAAGVSRNAHLMRERRANPELKRLEHLAISAKNKALHQLGLNHHEELLALVQIERKKVGLPPLVPRKGAWKQPTNEIAAKRKKKPVKRTQPVETVLVPKPKDVQASCRHNMGLQKLSYGTFCIECGERVR